MACLSAIKHSLVIRSLYLRLMHKGKTLEVAITACMRKMLTILNAVVRDRTCGGHHWFLTTDLPLDFSHSYYEVIVPSPKQSLPFPLYLLLPLPQG